MYSFLPKYFGRLLIYETILPKNATESGFLKTNEKKTSPMYLLTPSLLGSVCCKTKKGNWNFERGFNINEKNLVTTRKFTNI